MRVKVNVKFLRDAAAIYGKGGESAASIPEGLCPATAHSVGIDLRACLEQESLLIKPGERGMVGCGLAVEPLQVQDTETPDVGIAAGFVFSRSGLGAKQGLVVAQGVGVIDPDYRGEIIVWLLNTSSEDRVVQKGDRIAQLVFLTCFQPQFNVVNELGDTLRGSGGFGHTGK